jgi:hypothetical protein
VTRAEEEQISELVKAETVALRLNAGSQEAAFLSSFRPLNSVPTVVLVKYVRSQLFSRSFCLPVLQEWRGAAAHLR